MISALEKISSDPNELHFDNSCDDWYGGWNGKCHNYSFYQEISKYSAFVDAYLLRIEWQNRYNNMNYNQNYMWGYNWKFGQNNDITQLCYQYDIQNNCKIIFPEKIESLWIDWYRNFIHKYLDFIQNYENHSTYTIYGICQRYLAEWNQCVKWDGSVRVTWCADDYHLEDGNWYCTSNSKSRGCTNTSTQICEWGYRKSWIWSWDDWYWWDAVWGCTCTDIPEPEPETPTPPAPSCGTPLTTSDLSWYNWNGTPVSVLTDDGKHCWECWPSRSCGGGRTCCAWECQTVSNCDSVKPGDGYYNDEHTAT